MGTNSGNCQNTASTAEKMASLNRSFIYLPESVSSQRTTVIEKGLKMLRALVQSFVITWMDSNLASNTSDLRLFCGSLGFLCRYCRYFASRHAVYLHQSAFIIQILGVILVLIPGTFECMRMLPRLIRKIHALQGNCVTDLRVCCLPLVLVVPSSSPEDRLVDT